jgi:hypothetical protein
MMSWIVKSDGVSCSKLTKLLLGGKQQNIEIFCEVRWFLNGMKTDGEQQADYEIG